MSYQVLARRWRPRTLAEVRGQEHAVRALRHALDQGRLHHAVLFTGTRGVGKTTLARIVAKALNCIQGTSAEPCGSCPNCRDIDAGRFPDVYEIDAASRTRVDDTRELLDSVVYAPARGRCKVYLIDEVHMLSLSSFNALLKTLEEPPPHVQFLLATTDPQKLPVTVLSRCLKLHLRRLEVDEVVAQMREILEAEQVAYEDAALTELARAADGSMRDGLSLLDQALADGGGSLREEVVLAMLGSVSGELVAKLLRQVLAEDRQGAAATVAEIDAFAPSHRQVVARLLDLLHRVAVQQVLGVAAPGDGELQDLAERVSPELVQVQYQMCLQGWRDLADAPDPRAAFAMLVCRLLAFAPDVGPVSQGQAQPAGSASANAAREGSARAHRPASAGLASPRESRVARESQVLPEQAVLAANPGEAAAAWAAWTEAADLDQLTRMLAVHCVALRFCPDEVILRIDPGHDHLLGGRAEQGLREAVQRRFGQSCRLCIEAKPAAMPTPIESERERRAERQAQAEAEVARHPQVAAFEQLLQARLVPGSVVLQPGQADQEGRAR